MRRGGMLNNGDPGWPQETLSFRGRVPLRKKPLKEEMIMRIEHGLSSTSNKVFHVKPTERRAGVDLNQTDRRWPTCILASRHIDMYRSFLRELRNSAPLLPRVISH